MRPVPVSKSAETERNLDRRLRRFLRPGLALRDGTDRREPFVPFGLSSHVLRYGLDGSGGVVVIRLWHGREQRE